jgi:uncharacterized protein
MPVYLTPGLYYETVDAGQTRIPTIRTDVAAFIGVAERGPLDTPFAVHSFAQFQAMFGAFRNGPFLAYSAKAFFENGGDKCYIVRVAAPLAVTATDLLLPQPADRSFSVVLSVESFAPGAVVTVRQAPDIQQDALLADVDAVTRKLTWSHPLKPEFNPALSIDFATGNSPAEGVLLDAAGLPTLRIRAESPGSWGNRITVAVAHSSSAATATHKTTQPPGGGSSLVDSVTGFQPGTLVKVFQNQSPAPPLVKYHVVASIDPVHTRIVWVAPLEAAYNLANPISFETVEFSLSVYESGKIREVFAQLSLVPAHANYVERAIREGSSHYIRVEDLASISSAPDNLPNAEAPNLKRGRLALRAGRDGTAALTPEQFTGDFGADQKLGLHAIEDVHGISAVAIPDILMQPQPPVEFAPEPPVPPDPCGLCPPDPPDAPPPSLSIVEAIPGFSEDEILRVQRALVEHCERVHYRIALLDPPVFSKDKEQVEIARIQAWRAQFDSKHAALYFPWVLVYDPLEPRGRLVRAVPPSGHVAGIFARTDFETGVHRAPANQELRWAQDVLTGVDAATQGILNPAGINCIRSFPGRGLLLYGARTVSSLPAWRFVNVRRLFNMIEEATEDALQWTVFEPNNQILRRMVILALTSFLMGLWSKGALKGKRAEEVFEIRCDDVNNPASAIDNGQLIVDVAAAPVIPAEFVVFRVGRAQDTLKVTE